MGVSSAAVDPQPSSAKRSAPGGVAAAPGVENKLSTEPVIFCDMSPTKKYYVKNATTAVLSWRVSILIYVHIYYIYS